MNIQARTPTALLLCLPILLSACATTPRQNLALEDARQHYQRAQAQPAVATYAAEEMAQASAALNAADRAWSERKSASEVDHLAYMAGRRVDLAEATASSGAAQAVVDGAAAERDRLRLALRTREADSARRDARQSEADVGAARRDTEAARKEIDLLEAELAGLNARRTERGLVVTLGDVLFDTGRWQVRPEGTANLRRVADALRSHPAYSASVEGHTDNVGTASSNYLLSERRAAAVVQSLVDLGAPARQLQSRARGQEFPSASNATAAGRQMNRRVEIIFSEGDPDLVSN